MSTLIVSDAHGCLEELDELLQVTGVKKGDNVVFVGDLIDRGPDPIGVVRRVRENGWSCVLGNHEEKALRWLRHEEKRKATGKPNPMQDPSPIRKAEWLALSEEDVAWVRGLPTTLRVGAWLVVHAGFEPGLPLDQQDKKHVIRVRYVDAKGEMVGYERGSMDQPEGTVYWTEKWNLSQSVVYGHAVHSLEKPRIDTISTENGVHQCVGIDTGCVFGGKLTGMLLDTTVGGFGFAQVDAKKTYYAHSGQGIMT